MFPAGVVSTVVHEFTHSYTNALADHFSRELEKPGKKLFSLTEREMMAQAYGNWKTLMYESLNRACGLRYDAAFYGAEGERQAADYEVSRGFYWVPGLADVLAEYDAKPRKYKDLYEFFPKIAAYFEAYAGHAEEDLKARARKKLEEEETWKEKGPRISSMSPANGAADVPPDLKAITITFDRTMGGGYSIVQLDGTDHYPAVLEGSGFDPERKVFTMPVALQPGRSYVLGVNSEDYQGFKSSDGVPLFPVVYKFTTRSGS